MIGQEMSVQQVVEVAEKDRVFFSNSGGGVTFSGGEPFQQPEFLEQALEALQEAGLHTAIETTGYVAWSVMQRLERKIDLFLYDLKILDEREHKRVLGVSNEAIISNLRRLASIRDRIVLRIPVIPGYTAVGDNIPRILELVASLPNVKSVHLLPYHGLGKSKYAYARRAYPAEGTRPPVREQTEELAALAGRLGLDCTVGG
jgi:pyruvate formate lyase activating enzyme